jgi:hypothetical protein
METLIRSAVSTLLRKAHLLIHDNEKCEVEEFVHNSEYEDGFVVSLEVDYYLKHGNPSPDGEPDSIEVYDVTMKIDDDIIDYSEYCNKTDFEIF